MTTKKCLNCEATPEGRQEGLLKQAARLLATAGGFKNRVYVVHVFDGRATSVEEFPVHPPLRTNL